MSCNIFCGKTNGEKSSTQHYTESNMIFNIPKPSYTIIIDNKSIQRGSLYQKCTFIHKYLNNNVKDNTKFYIPFLSTSAYQIQKINTKHKLILLHILNKACLSLPKDHQITLLISHSNNTDLGIIYPELLDISILLKCNIICYDYSGFGRSEGKISEINLISDIEQVGDFAINNLNLTLEQIIGLGKSIGVIPTLNGVSITKNCAIKGVIGMSMVKNDKNVFDVEEAKKEIFSPILLIHGMNDTNYTVQDIEEFRYGIKYVNVWYPKSGDHYNIGKVYRSKVFKKFKLFIDYLGKNKYKKIKKDQFAFANEEIIDETTIHFNKKEI